MTDWIGELRRYPIEQVARLLELEVAHGNRFAACPACRAGHRACSVHTAGQRWRCHSCGAGGDAADLVAVVAVGHTLTTATPEEYAATRALAASLGLCEGEDVATSPRPRVTPRLATAPKNEPTRPPIEEVAALWAASTSLATEPEGAVAAFLRGRGYPPGEVAALGVVRLLPLRYPWPAWWPYPPTSLATEPEGAVAAFLRGRGYPPGEVAALGVVRLLPLRYPWPAWWPYPPATWRLVVRAHEADGELASLHARAVVDGAAGKTRWPRGYQAGELLLADQEGLLLLRGEGRPDTRVLVVEGLTGLVWATLMLRRIGLDLPVLAGTAGSWPALARVSWPQGAVVFAATDDDDTGERYAAEIRRAVPRNIPVRRWRFNRGNHGKR